MSERWNPQMDRRTLFKVGLVAGLTALGFKDASPAVAAPALSPPSPSEAGSTQSVDQEPIPQNGWGDIPIVEGEPALMGELVWPPGGILEFIGEMNSRNIPSASKDSPSIATMRPKGTLVEVAVEMIDLAGTHKDLNIWNGGKLIFNPETIEVFNPESAETVYVAESANNRFVVDPSSIPPEVQELYRTPAALPQSDMPAVDTGKFEAMFNNIGGSAEGGPDIFAASVWGISIPQQNKTTGEVDNPELFSTSPIASWQRSIGWTAFQDPQDLDLESGGFDICTITGGESPCNLYRRIDKETGSIDVFTRIENPDASIPHSTIFAVTRLTQDTRGELAVSDIGFVTKEGLSVAYGKDAHDIAANTTAFSGEQVTELVEGINSLPQTKVFLPGLEGGPQFGQKIQTDEGQTVAYRNIAEKGKPADYRVYIARQEEDGESGAESGEVEYGRYFEYKTEAGVSGELIPLPEQEKLQTYIAEYTDVMGVEGDVVMSYGTVNTRKGSVLVANAVYDSGEGDSSINGEIPLMIAIKNARGEWEWKEATREVISTTSGFEASATIVGWRAIQDPTWQKAMKDDVTGFQLDDLVMRKSIEPNQGGYSGELTKSLSQAKTARNQGKEFYIGSGLVAGSQDFNPEWLWNGSFTKDEMLEHASRYIHDVLEGVPDVDTVAVANEMLPHLLNKQNLWTERNRIDRTLLLQTIYRVAREVVPDAKLALRDYSVEFAGYKRSDDFFNLIESMNTQEVATNGAKLIDVAEFQLPLFLKELIGVDPAMNISNFTSANNRTRMMDALKRNIERFQEIDVEVAITELFVPLNNLPGNNVDQMRLQAQIYHDIYETCAEMGVRVGTHRLYDDKRVEYPTGGTSPYPRDEKGKKTPAYFAINQGILSGQSKK